MGDKEALERLNEVLEMLGLFHKTGLTIQGRKLYPADISWLIAEREGLEREVAAYRTGDVVLRCEYIMLKAERDDLAADAVTALTGKVIAERRAEAAESELSALEEAAQQLISSVTVVEGALGRRSTRTYTQAEVDSILKAAFPKVSVAPPSQG